MDFLTMSISSSGSWTSVERIMSGTRHPIRFVIEAKNICYIINPNHKDDEGDFFGIPVYKDHEIADSTDVLVTGEFQNKGG